MIRDEGEVHPLEFDEDAIEGTDAELILDPLNIDSIAVNERTSHGSASTIAMAVTTESSTAADIFLL